MLNKQWYALKKYANEKNVKIVGDMPAYPAFDSVEVKYHPECYQLKDGQMEFIAGAPPDFYNADGQSWGNPVYNYEFIKKNNYQYLLDRYKDYLKRYDIIRIDYFKGLESFYKIPNGKTPREGIYEQGPRYEFIDKLLEFSDKSRYWVENLGDITADTLKLKNHYGLTGQNLTIFSVDYARGYDPSFKIENIIDYPCNHDTNTSIGWYEDLDPSYRERVREYLVNNECNSPYINDALMEYCFKSSARVVMLPIQEVIGLGPEARLNRPGIIADSNWSWKLIDFDAFKETIEIIKLYNK
jgi:4-alpha-glucanotransferase